MTFESVSKRLRERTTPGPYYHGEWLPDGGAVDIVEQFRVSLSRGPRKEVYCVSTEVADDPVLVAVTGNGPGAPHNAEYQAFILNRIALIEKVVEVARRYVDVAAHPWTPDLVDALLALDESVGALEKEGSLSAGASEGKRIRCRARIGNPYGSSTRRCKRLEWRSGAGHCKQHWVDVGALSEARERWFEESKSRLESVAAKRGVVVSWGEQE